MLVTMVNAMPVGTFLLFPAMLKIIGITLETPKPTIIKAMVQGIKLGNKTAMYKPDEMTIPLAISTFLAPFFATNISLKNRPEAILIMKVV